MFIVTNKTNKIVLLTTHHNKAVTLKPGEKRIFTDNLTDADVAYYERQRKALNVDVEVVKDTDGITLQPNPEPLNPTVYVKPVEDEELEPGAPADRIDISKLHPELDPTPIVDPKKQAPKDVGAPKPEPKATKSTASKTKSSTRRKTTKTSTSTKATSTNPNISKE